jgi:FkbM family methyltransferase
MRVPSAIAKRMISRLFTQGSSEVRRHAADQVGRGFEEITYRRLADRGFRPSAIIDVGAYEGNWTRLANAVFGPTPTLMIEAQPGKRPVLESVIEDLPQVRLANAALSAKAGEELTFFEMETGSSLMPELSNAPRTTRTVKTRVLDEVVQEVFPNESPLFLKVDVQGAELEVLRGGTETLARCELVQLEVAMLQYNEGAPLLPDVAAFMADRDFLPIEVSGFSRPRDVLVQIDLIFARKDSPLRPERFVF